MSEVKRYECFGADSEMRETHGGGHVLYSDYAALEAKAARYREALEEISRRGPSTERKIARKALEENRHD